MAHIKVTIVYDQLDARKSVKYINQYRTANGLTPLTYDYALEKVAMQRTAEAAVQLSHCNAAGYNFTGCKDWSLVLHHGTSGYENGAENLAGGNYANGEIMVRFFMQEEGNRFRTGHRQIILDSQYKAVGIAHAYLTWSDVGTPEETVTPHARDYWVQIYRTYNSNEHPTAAKMGRATIAVEADIRWSSLQLTPDRTRYNLIVGESAVLPKVVMTYKTARKYWELNKFELADKVHWSVDNPLVAVSNGNTIMARGGGVTTLKGSCGNFTVTIPITVKGRQYIPKSVAAPRLTKAACHNGTVTLAWRSVPGVQKYQVSYRQTSGRWKTLAVTKKTTLKVDKTLLSHGAKYYFSVRCLNEKGKIWSPRSNIKAVLFKLVYPVPKISSVQVVEAGIKLNWQKSGSDAKYRILYRVNGRGKWKKLTDTGKLTYTWRKAVPGTTYDFTIRCISADGKRYTSSFDKAGKRCEYLPVALLTSAVVHENTVTVSVQQPKCSRTLKHTLLLFDINGVERARMTVSTGKQSVNMMLPSPGYWYIQVQTEGIVRTGVGSSKWARIINPKYRVVHCE